MFMILTGAAFALKVYASISIGHQVQKHTGLLSLATFVGLCIVESMAGSFVGVKTFEISGGSNIEQQVVDTVLYAQQIMLVGIAFTAVVAAIYYVITRLLMKYKLNIE